MSKDGILSVLVKDLFCFVQNKDSRPTFLVCQKKGLHFK